MYSLTFEEALQHVETGKNILLYPLDISVVTLAPLKLDIHDAIIVGTAISLSDELGDELGQPVSIVTIDKTISESGLVPVLW